MSLRKIQELSFSSDTKGFRATGTVGEDVLARQSLVKGFDPSALEKVKIGFIGAGGINSMISLATARRGYSNILIIDFDEVEPSNLSRQGYFQDDIGKPKAHCLAKNLAIEATSPDFTAVGIALAFEEIIEKGINLDCDVFVVGVDRVKVKPGKSGQ